MKKLVCYWSGPLLKWAEKSLVSMRDSAEDSEVIMYTDGLSDEDQEWFDGLGEGFSAPLMDAERWKKESMCYRVSLLKELAEASPDGTEIISIDLDTIVQGDLFTVFEKEFDVFLTSRGYPYHYSVNAGCWGFKVSDKSKEFLEYFTQQLKNPTWPAYVRFLEAMTKLRGNSSTWWLDQDFLCCLYDYGPPIEDLVIHDASPKYNYTYDETSAPISDIVKDYKSKLGDKKYLMLHLKGPLKDVFYDN